MPSLFAKTAEEHAGRHLQAHEVVPMDAIPRIIEGALHKAFRVWEARGNSEVPTSEASVASMSFMPETPTSLTYALGQPAPAAAAYHHPRQPTPVMQHGFPQGGHFTGGARFPAEVQQHTTQADDSGFEENVFFTSGPPVDLSAFAPQYQRGPWDASLELLGAGSFEADGSLGAHFRVFQDG
jgi:hypothetical protein